jgi:HlyD family secretion protein
MASPKKTLKYLLIVVGAIILFIIIGKQTGFLGSSFVVEVAVDTAQVRNITEIITANGKIQPEVEVKISSDVSGEIVELHVKEGERVEKNQLLLKIRPDIYESNLERMEASLNVSRANLENSKARLSQVEAQFAQTQSNYDRNKQLYEKKVISQAEWDNISSAFNMGKAEIQAAKQSVASAEFTVKSAEASLKEAKENLYKTSIYSPVSGTVSRMNVEMGERVVGTIQMTGTELLRIANLNNMEVRVDVSENDILRVKFNDTASIDIDAYPSRKFMGIVTQIANSATTASSLTSISTDQVANFEVRIRILKSSFEDLISDSTRNFYPFRPGMSATADIQTKTVYNVLSVPIQSVTFRIDSLELKMKEQSRKTTTEAVTQEKKKEYVFVSTNDNQVVMKEVKTGIQNENYIEITDGLNAGDLIVSAPYTAISRHLKDKTRIKVVDKKTLFEDKK